jgi:hypothetical protein
MLRVDVMGIVGGMGWVCWDGATEMKVSVLKESACVFRKEAPR